MQGYWTVFAAFAVFNCFFFSVVLWNHSIGYQRANRYLAFLFLIHVLSSITWMIPEESLPLFRHWTYFLLRPLSMFIGILIYYFIKTLTSSKNNMPNFGYHLIPVGIVYLYQIVCFMLFWHRENVPLEAHFSYSIAEIFYKIHLFVYLYGSYRLITKYKLDIEQVLSNQPESNINRLVNIFSSASLLWLSWVLVFHVLPPNWFFIHPIITVLCLFYIFYSAIKQEPIMDMQAIIQNIEILEEHKETVSKEITPQMLTLKSELETLMVREKPFLDPELSLQKLAEKMNVSLHFLSHTINTCFEENFFQFINRYRVEESKILLRHPDMSHYNILQIAYEAGFNSKTTFNTTFKKMTGISPSAYQKAA